MKNIPNYVIHSNTSPWNLKILKIKRRGPNTFFLFQMIKTKWYVEVVSFSTISDMLYETMNIYNYYLRQLLFQLRQDLPIINNPRFNSMTSQYTFHFKLIE
jgi:hypothetical protein